MKSKFSNTVNILSKSRFLIFIFITLAVLMITSALIELSQSKRELYALMEEQAKSLIGSILTSSENSLLTNQEVNTLIEERLLNNAEFVEYLYRQGTLTDNILTDLCEQNNLYRINIFNSQGDKIFASHQQIHFPDDSVFIAGARYSPILEGLVDTLMIGVVPARYEDANRFAVAIRSKDNSAIVVNIDAEEILKFRRNIGFGPLLRNIVSQNPSIIFAALQDTNEILAASGNVQELESLGSSQFLLDALNNNTFATHESDFDSTNVFEVVHPFFYENRQIGLLRIGLSLEPINAINDRIYRRLSMITIVLFIVGSIIFALIFIQQRLGLLRKEYSAIETYSSNIINNASDAIIVYNKNEGIKIFNRSAEHIFGISEKNIINKQLDSIFNKIQIEKFADHNTPVVQIEYKADNIDKHLEVSRTEYSEEGTTNTIFLIRDLTEQKQLEEQLERNQRLTAMGELASGVAHEIRNPLNSISTIVQQLDKDFVPQENSTEYHELSQIVSKEIKRINNTIQHFLQFAKPEKIRIAQFELSNLFDEIKKQYAPLLKEKNIELIVKNTYEEEVRWDYNKIKEALINLIENAADAIEYTGEISILVNNVNNKINIEVNDTGEGISDEERKKIFNLYYTTKASGTGIGLSIVQRIIFEHNGTITVDSTVENGTSFLIKLPKSVI